MIRRHLFKGYTGYFSKHYTYTKSYRKKDQYPELRLLFKYRSTLHELYLIILEECRLNFKKGKGFVCFSSPELFSLILRTTIRTAYKNIKFLVENDCIIYEKLNSSENLREDSRPVTHKYIPLVIPQSLKDLKDKIKEVE